ncbi:MAG: endonuclease/exonuclease/phosphatase family protein [Candidatus Hermodarchaeota archaeon]
MPKYQNVSSIILVGIIVYLFIECFYNLIVDINAYVFMNFSEILTILPILIVALLLLIAEFLIFTLKKINKKYKPFTLLYLACGLRISSQFVILPSALFVINFLMIFTLLIFFMVFFNLVEKNKEYMSISQFLESVIIGLGIYYALLTVNISSNLTSDLIKIIPTFAFVGIIIFINHSFFHPKRIETLIAGIGDKTERDPNKKPVSFFHFIILGVLFIFSAMWIFNPMALSAYDIINININGLSSNSMNIWPTYGFTYYTVIIFITAVLSYILIVKYIFSLNQGFLRIIVVCSIGVTCLLTFLAIFVIQNDLTIISSIYTSVMTIVGVFSIVLYLAYLFNFYTFDSTRRLSFGILFFFLTALVFLVLHTSIMWYEYMSLINHLVIQIITCVVLILISELINVKFPFIIKERPSHMSKTISIAFAVILIINGVSIGVVAQNSKVELTQNPEPTFMIWNIHNAIGDDDVISLDRIVQDINQFLPDIVGLNEVDLGALKTSSIDLPSYFAHRLNMYYFYGYTFYKHYGNLILSKYPILEAEIIPLPLGVPSAEPRSLIRAKLQINMSIWTVFITHLSTEEDDRLIQVPFIVSEIEKEVAFERIVWMGDFNFEPSSTEYTLINSTSILKFIDTYRFLNSDPGFTGHFDENHVPHKRIDYIMCSSDLVPKTSQKFCSVSSDHCSVITQF